MKPIMEILKTELKPQIKDNQVTGFKLFEYDGHPCWSFRTKIDGTPVFIEVQNGFEVFALVSKTGKRATFKNSSQLDFVSFPENTLDIKKLKEEVKRNSVFL